MSGGPGEGARDPKQAEAASEGSQLRPGGFGEETRGHGHTAGQKILNMPSSEWRRGQTSSLSVAGLFRSKYYIDCCCFDSLLQDCLPLPAGKSENCRSAGSASEVTAQSRKHLVMFFIIMSSRGS